MESSSKINTSVTENISHVKSFPLFVLGMTHVRISFRMIEQISAFRPMRIYNFDMTAESQNDGAGADVHCCAMDRKSRSRYNE
jgi:hypothetical protein